MKALQFGYLTSRDFHPLRCSAEAFRLGHLFRNRGRALEPSLPVMAT